MILLVFSERIAMHGLRFPWSRTPVQAAIVLALAGASLAGLPAQARRRHCRCPRQSLAW